MVLWDSGRLAGLIAAAYPLKPHGTAAPVSLSKGNIGPLRRGRVAGITAFVPSWPPLTWAGIWSLTQESGRRSGTALT